MSTRGESGPIWVVASDDGTWRRIAERLAVGGYRPIRWPREASEKSTDVVPEVVVLDGACTIPDSLDQELPHCAWVVLADDLAGEVSDGAVPWDPPEDLWREIESARQRWGGLRRVLGERPTTAILEDLPDGVWAIDARFEFVFVNAAAERLLGAPARQLLGCSILESVPAGDTSWSACAFEVVLAEHRPFHAFEREVQDRQGDRRWLETSAEPRFDETGAFVGYTGVDRNVTDRLVAEREQAQRETQRREAMLRAQLGTISGEVAHDLNNVLTAILGYVELSRTKTTSAESHAAVDRIEAVAAQAVELGRSLSFLAGPGIEPRRLLDLRRLVDEVVEARRRTEVEVEMEGEECDPLWVRGVPTRLARVVAEVLDNACEASPGGRPVRIAVNQIGVGRDARAAITIADEGKGIPSTASGDIFAPFVTSKPRGVGTGLGLAVARSLIEQHQGSLTLRPEAGGGTRCRIELSCARDAACERGGPEHPPVVLVAEDHDHVRELVTEALASAGFPTLAAADGDEAARLIELHAARIRFAIIDLDLPGRSGVSVLQACRRRNPALPALIMTGRTEPFSPDEVPSDVAILRKPFVLTELVEAVHQAWQKPTREATLEAEG